MLYLIEEKYSLLSVTWFYRFAEAPLVAVSAVLQPGVGAHFSGQFLWA